jgi:hypothetical protein
MLCSFAPAWFQWYPQGAIFPGALTFQPGDTVSVAVAAPSRTQGVATITNRTSGKSASQQVTNAALPLCRSDAGWMVQAGSATLPNFGTVRFADASVVLLNGSTVGSAGADLWEMVDAHGLVTASTAHNNDGTVTVAYVEEWADFGR